MLPAIIILSPRGQMVWGNSAEVVGGGGELCDAFECIGSMQGARAMVNRNNLNRNIRINGKVHFADVGGPPSPKLHQNSLRKTGHVLEILA